MSTAERIAIAEERVAGMQSHLDTVESVLGKVEQVAVSGRESGGLVRRLIKVVLLVSAVAAIALVVKKFKHDGCPFAKGKAEEPIIIAEGEDEIETAGDDAS